MARSTDYKSPGALGMWAGEQGGGATGGRGRGCAEGDSKGRGAETSGVRLRAHQVQVFVFYPDRSGGQASAGKKQGKHSLERCGEQTGDE